MATMTSLVLRKNKSYVVVEKFIFFQTFSRGNAKPFFLLKAEGRQTGGIIYVFFVVSVFFFILRN